MHWWILRSLLDTWRGAYHHSWETCITVCITRVMNSSCYILVQDFYKLANFAFSQSSLEIITQCWDQRRDVNVARKSFPKGSVYSYHTCSFTCEISDSALYRWNNFSLFMIFKVHSKAADALWKLPLSPIVYNRRESW